jgi:hypothetical protein
MVTAMVMVTGLTQMDIMMMKSLNHFIKSWRKKVIRWKNA